MKTILYIDQKQVQAIQIRRKGVEYFSKPLPVGAVLNGVILNADQLQSALTEMNLKAKKVTLVIDSSNILSKKLTLPKVSRGKLLQMVKSEFDLFHTEQSYLYDTNVLASSPSITAMGYAVTQEMIDTYLKACKNCGLTVQRVDFALNGLINYISQRVEFQGRTFLFNVISGDYLLSLFFENGIYKLSNRLRLLHVNQGDLFYQELYNRLSAMTQFGSSERFTHTIADSYYIGISKEDVTKLAQYVEGILPVNVQFYQDANWDMDYFLPALATYKHKQDINFAKNHQQIAKRKHKWISIALKTAVLAAVLGLVGYHSWTIYEDYQAACAQYDAAQATVTKPETLEALTHFSDLQAENANLQGEIALHEAFFALLDSGAVVEDNVLEQIFEGDVVNNFSFDFVSGVVRISGTFPSNAEATDYAARLRDKGFFVTMDYEGYYLNEGTNQNKPAVNSYQFNITAGYGPIVEISSEEVASK